MQIERAMRLIDSIPEGWVRVAQIRKRQGGFDLDFAIHTGQRGKKVAGWTVRCLRVHEAKIDELDGGGLRVYSGHAAARQYVARQAELRWDGSANQTTLLGVLYEAHYKTVDDWIPFDRYLPFDAYKCFKTLSTNHFVCRGPDFLMRVYAKALRSKGEMVRFTLQRARKTKPARPKVLHFGSSYVVADVFTAEPE